MPCIQLSKYEEKVVCHFVNLAVLFAVGVVVVVFIVKAAVIMIAISHVLLASTWV